MKAKTKPPALRQLATQIRRGEGTTIEFKRSTGELKEAMQTICAFLNGEGGTVLFGVRNDGRIEGQHVSDKTLQEIAQAGKRFEPSVALSATRIPVGQGREIVSITVEKSHKNKPFAYDGRAYERITSTTQRMSQADYARLLRERDHDRYRWENAVAKGISLRDIDSAEAKRLIKYSRSAGRLVGSAPRTLADILDRLKLREDGLILNAAVVLFGKKFLPNYPQCELRLARFRGTDNLEFLDNKIMQGPALKLLEEAEIFCARHFPQPGRIVPGKLRREEKPLIPPDAMREILVNAIIHRDYQNAGGCVSLAIFDDRVEVWNEGGFPLGITPELLTRRHKSIPRNPIIAAAFNRAGLIEKWGSGTNRVITMCRKHGIKPPTFAEISDAAVVTFHVPVGATRKVTPPVTTTVATTVAATVKLLLAACRTEISREALQESLGLLNKMHFIKHHLRPALKAGLLERTIPDKPNSRLQKYRLTKKGRKAIAR